MTGLDPPECGPFLRTLRVPGESHQPECKSRDDCKENEDCMERPRGNKCMTAEQFMEEEFLLGHECKSNEDCPEACFTSQDIPACGPFLRKSQLITDQGN